MSRGAHIEENESGKEAEITFITFLVNVTPQNDYCWFVCFGLKSNPHELVGMYNLVQSCCYILNKSAPVGGALEMHSLPLNLRMLLKMGSCVRMS